MSLLKRSVIVLTLRTGGLAEAKGSDLKFLWSSRVAKRKLVWVQLRMWLLKALYRLTCSTALACSNA
jgi:hypothetical protein